jgi:predicted LPLAT superfamily acyltransferase
MRDLTIELTHRPGELARVASMLARHHVTLKAGCALAIGRRLIARLIPSDIDAARRALDAAEVRFEESEVVKVLLESRAGELAMLSSRLTEAGIGVRAIYITATAGHLVELAVVPDNAQRARRLLEGSVFDTPGR